MKPRGTMELADFEAELRARRRLLSGDLQALEASEAQDVSGRAGMSSQPADVGAEREACDISLARRESESVEIQEIDDALERLRDGTFGVCDECGKTISQERLHAIPYARFCLPCKQAEEA